MSIKAPPGSEPTALYRVFGDAGVLLYIGISNDFGSRWKRHARIQPWWNEKRRQTVEWYPSRGSAEEAEVSAIKSEYPRYNTQHNVGAPRPRGPRQRPPHAVELDRGIATLMREYREREGLSQAAFAARMSELGHGWHQSTVYKIEADARSLEFWEACHFAGLLGMPVGELAALARAASSALKRDVA